MYGKTFHKEESNIEIGRSITLQEKSLFTREN